MFKVNRPVKRVLIGITIAVIVFFIILVACISPIAKYLIEKYDDKILGRKIEMSWIYVNPLTGHIYIKNLRVYENHSDSLFFTAQSVTANFSMLKLFSKTYEISSITVYKPWGRIIQAKGAINFQDIIDHYRKKDKTPNNNPPTKFNILNCVIQDGEFHYDEISIPVTYYIKHVNIECPGHWWNVDSMFYKVALQSGPESGRINGTFSLNFKSLNYYIRATVDSFDLKPLSQYMKELSNYGNFGGWVDSKVQIEGCMKDRLALKTRGIVTIDRFHFGPSTHEDYASFQHFVLDLIEGDPGGKKYLIDSVMIDRPYFRYERYDHSLDNYTLMFGKAGSKPGIHSDQEQFNLILKIAEYLVELARNFEQSYYRINKFTLHKGDIIFNDYSLREKFAVEVMPVSLRADSIDKNNERMNFKLKGTLKPYGDIGMDMSLDPNDFGFFDVSYDIFKVPVSVFNPYLISYTSFPMDKGTLQLKGQWSVADSMINSTNHLLIMDPRIGRRVKRNDTKWLPMPFIMSLVREPGEAIQYDVPVSGNLTKPKFAFKNVIATIVQNIFVKPFTAPYLVQVKKLETTVEKMLTLTWQMREATLTTTQQAFVGKMAKFMKQHPGYTISISSQVYTDKEREHIEFFEFKKKYYLSTLPKGHQLNEADSLLIENLSVKDSLVERYLNSLCRDTMMFNVQQKCEYVLGNKFITVKLHQLLETRKNAFLQAFKDNGTDTQIKFTKPEPGIPFNGYSRYKIDYNGNVPDELRNAYEKMDALNNDAPRTKYKSERWLPKVKGLKKEKTEN